MIYLTLLGGKIMAKCKICNSKHKMEIEAMITLDIPKIEIFSKYRVNRANIQNHINHTPTLILQPEDKVEDTITPESQVWDGTRWNTKGEARTVFNDGLMSAEDMRILKLRQEKRNLLPPEQRAQYMSYITPDNEPVIYPKPVKDNFYVPDDKQHKEKLMQDKIKTKINRKKLHVCEDDFKDSYAVRQIKKVMKMNQT